jgi:hypothetical protein
MVDGFAVYGCDSSAVCETYFVGGVCLSFVKKNLSVNVSFDKADGVLGSFINSFILSSSLGHDDNTRVVIAGAVINTSNWRDSCGIFNRIIDVVEKSCNNRILVEITYRLETAYNYQTMDIIHIVHPDFNDTYYLEMEMSRRLSKK